MTRVLPHSRLSHGVTDPGSTAAKAPIVTPVTVIMRLSAYVPLPTTLYLKCQSINVFSLQLISTFTLFRLPDSGSAWCCVIVELWLGLSLAPRPVPATMLSRRIKRGRAIVGGAAEQESLGSVRR